MQRATAQSFRLPAPTLTEKNTPDQTGRVIIVTGGYAGVGKDLCQILYANNATVYVAGRSKEKGEAAIKTIKSVASDSKGRIEFLPIDLSDLKTIKPGVEQFLAAEERLDVLVNNAGVMFPPKGSKDAQGEELQIGTNCVGHYLLHQLLAPTLSKTAKSSEPGSVRVTWAGSLGVDVLSPKPGGMNLKESGKPKVLDQKSNYGQSKVGNLFMSVEESRHTAETGVVHLCFNPGNLKTELQRHASSFESAMFNWMLHPAINGAYTELWAAVSPDVKVTDSGKYVWPWGRFGNYRPDIEAAVKSSSEGGTGASGKFVEWCKEQTKSHM